MFTGINQLFKSLARALNSSLGTINKTLQRLVLSQSGQNQHLKSAKKATQVSTTSHKKSKICPHCSTTWGKKSKTSPHCSTTWGRKSKTFPLCSTTWGKKSKSFPHCSTTWGKKSKTFPLCSTTWGEKSKTFPLCSTTWGGKAKLSLFVRPLGGLWVVLRPGKRQNHGDEIVIPRLLGSSDGSPSNFILQTSFFTLHPLSPSFSRYFVIRHLRSLSDERRRVGGKVSSAARKLIQLPCRIPGKRF